MGGNSIHTRGNVLCLHYSVKWFGIQFSQASASFSVLIERSPTSPSKIMGGALEALLTRWSGKCLLTLFYGSRIQLVNRIADGKCTYWTKGIATLDSVVKKVRELAYKFIWDGRKKGSYGPKWFSSSLRGVRDLPIITAASNIKIASKYYDKSDSILLQWIQDKYIKAKVLGKIQIWPSIDSHFWKAFIPDNIPVDKCMYFRPKVT